MSQSEETTLVSFQELWRIAVGKSSIKDPILVGNELNKRTKALGDCLKYYKPNSNDSKTKVKNDKTIPTDLQNFCSKLAEFLDLDCVQVKKVVVQYSQYEFHGSKEKFDEVLKDERSHFSLFGCITNYYFSERLYLLRTIKHILSYFEDEDHRYHQEYAEVVNGLKSRIGKEILSLYEKMFSSEPPTSKVRGPNFTQQVVVPFALQAVKEQSELLEILFTYYSHFEMSSQTLLKLAKIFKEQGYGVGHPLLEVIDRSVLASALTRLNTLQQMILIEGFDMEYLQRLAEASGVDQHKLSISKAEFQQLDKIFCALTDMPAMAPVLLAWTTIRYQVMPAFGGDRTQRLGERVIEQKVWFQVMHIVELHPAGTEKPTAQTIRNVLRGLLSCVMHSFHEDTLGDYSELVEAVTKVLSFSRTASEMFWSEKKRGTGLHLLLSSAAGYFPLHLSPLLKLLTALSSGPKSSYEVFSFICNLPSVAEYLAARGTDDVESIENGSYWKLLMNKSMAVAGGFHHIKVPVGTVGNLVESQLGSMVQWQTTVNGWRFLHAEIESVLQYRGQSSDLEMLGYIDKATLIYGLVVELLDSVKTYEDLDKKDEVLDVIEPFVDKIFPLIQRLVNMVNPPLDLFSLCIRCLNGWIQCDSSPNTTFDMSAPTLKENANLVSTITGMSRIQFLPFSERNFMENLQSAAKLPLHYVSELPAQLYPGIFGNVLANVERPNGRYPITVAVLDLVLTLVEKTIGWCSENFEDDDEWNLKLVIATIAPSVLYFLKEVFPTFDKWRPDPETTEKIGLRCLNLCHATLRCYHPKNETNQSLWSPIQHTILTVLTHSRSVDIILRLISIPVDKLHSLLASEPDSLAATNVMEGVRFGFSVLNNILRLEHDALSVNKGHSESESEDHNVESSYLHSVLAAHSPGGQNLVSLVAGYLYHKHDASLPRMALSLLRRISVAVPMSLHASLGQDVAAVRDILLSRLKSKSESANLKIGILEFLTISVHTQPGLLELFLDLEQIDKEKPEKGLKLGKSSCLSAVLMLIDKEMQGTQFLPAELHSACVKLLSSLWVDRRHSALRALRSYSASRAGKASFWHSLLLPLFSENPPREIAQSDLLEACAHILNTLGLESFYTTPSGKDPTLEPIMKEFATKDRFNHWSKVMVCVCKTLPRLNELDTETRLIFVAAWKMFVLTSDLKNPIRVKNYINDIMMALGALVENVETHKSMVTALNLTTSLLLTLLHKSPKDTLTDFKAAEKIFSQIISNVETLDKSPEKVDRTQIHFHAIALHLYAKLKQLSDRTLEFSKSVMAWLRLSCSMLRNLLRNNGDKEKNTKKNTELSLVLIQTIQEVFVMCESSKGEEDVTSWLKILMEESTFNLLATVIVNLIGSAHEEDDGNALRASMAIAILRLFSTVCRHQKAALAIQKTGILPEFCLKTVNAYTDAVVSQKKKWISVYHLSLVLIQNMLDSLSHGFLDHTLDYIGVHNDRIVQCLQAVSVHQTSSTLQEAMFTTSLLNSLTKSFVQEWRFKFLHSYQVCVENVATLCHSCVAMLLRPRLLQEAIEMSSKKDGTVNLPPSVATQSHIRQTSVVSQKSLSQDEIETPSPKFLAVRRSLFSILGNCLSVFKHLSPDLCQILLDQIVDPDEFQPILSISFSTPSLDQLSLPTFGTIINASNVAWKIISQASSSPELSDVASFVMDNALVVAVAQGMFLIKHPGVSNRDKQRLRRELGDELISVLRSANRHSRLSGGGVTSPQSSPAGVRTVLKSRSSLAKQFPPSAMQRRHLSSSSIDRGMLDLVDLFVKGVLR